MEIAIVLGLVLLLFTAAAATVAWEDRRATRREATRRAARLACLGEPDTATRLAPPPSEPFPH